MNYFYIPNLKISVAKLQQVSSAPVRQKSVTGRTVQVISDEVMAQSRGRWPECKCEDSVHMAKLNLSPLYAGFLVSQLWELESGCTKGRYVCPRLDYVRRRYGK